MSGIANKPNVFFTVTHSSGRAGPRLGCLNTGHGTIETPCFLPIASHGNLRAISFQQARACGTDIIMANAWHVYRATGPKALQEMGGAHRLIGWDGVLFTDSGGYQIFSLRDTSALSDTGVSFGPETDALTPEHAIEIQKRLGSDVMFALDDCAPFPCDDNRAEEAVRRTSAWAQRCMTAYRSIPDCYAHAQTLYGIIQGSTRASLRKRSVEEVAQLDFGGYGIGGLSIGMPRTAIREMTALTCEYLPFDNPRHLLGVGLPGQILQGIADGADTFDCVLPIRKGQRGIAYTARGELRYKEPQPGNIKDRPLDENCHCPTCNTYSREQLRLLFKSNKTLAGELAVIHNLYFYHQVLAEARQAIRENRFPTYLNNFIAISSEHPTERYSNS